MAIRTVYINPGDVLDIRIIRDPDLPKNNKEWEYQVQPRKMLLQICDSLRVRITDPAISVELATPYGKVIKYLQ